MADVDNGNREDEVLDPEDELDGWDDGDEGDEVEVREAYGSGGGQDAPWSPLPTFVARQYQQENPDAVVEFIFPRVYEENRSAMVRDLSTAQASSWITHRRAAEQGVKELGFEEYDYEEEQQNIQEERKKGIGQPPLGAGDDLAKALGLGGPPAATRAEPVLPSTPAPGAPPTRRHDEPEEKRADLSAPAKAEFRRDMRQAEEALIAELHGLASGLRRVREAMTEPTTAERTAALQTQVDRLVEGMQQVVERLSRPPEPPVVHVEPVVVPAPEVRVEVKPAKVVVPRPEVVNIPTPPHERRVVDKKIESDRSGRAVRVIETDDLGQQRRFRVIRNDAGQVIGLEPDESL